MTQTVLALEEAVQDRNGQLQLPSRIRTTADRTAALSYLMGAVREVLYPPRRPTEAEARRDASIIRKLLMETDTPVATLEAIVGLRLLARAGELRPMAEPADSLTARALLARWGKARRPLWQMARSRVHCELARGRPAARGPADPQTVRDLLGGAIAAAGL